MNNKEFYIKIATIFRPCLSSWLVKTFILSGLSLYITPYWVPWVEYTIEISFGKDIYDGTRIAPILIIIGLILAFFKFIFTDADIRSKIFKFIFFDFLLYGMILFSFILFLGLIYFVNNNFLNKELTNEPNFTQAFESYSFSYGGGITFTYASKILEKKSVFPDILGRYHPVKFYLNSGKLYSDITIPSSSGMPPIKIIKNKYYGVPHDWDVNKSARALEIVDSAQNPIYQIIYKNNGHIILNGLFLVPLGTIAIDSNRLVLNPSPDYVFNLDRIFKYPEWRFPGEYEDR